MTTQPKGDNGVAQWQLGTAPPASETKSNVDIGKSAICSACPHPWSSHDQIAARYCTATATSTGGHSRGCVCANKLDHMPEKAR